MITEAIRNGPTFSFLVIGIIIIFGPLIAERLRLPGLLGLLIGGALIGPNMLGILDDFSAIENIGQIGILYLIFLAGLQGIPTELIEAARIDGANTWQSFRHVTLPLMTPVIFFQLIFAWATPAMDAIDGRCEPS